jgi:hypothetical protein
MQRTYAPELFDNMQEVREREKPEPISCKPFELCEAEPHLIQYDTLYHCCNLDRPLVAGNFM